MSAPIGIIGGTALARMADLRTDTQPVVSHTQYGLPSGPLIVGTFAGREVCFLMRHGPDAHIAPHAINYRANIRALAGTGCKRVIAIAAVGGISEPMTPGRAVIPHQIIDYSWGRAHTFFDDPDVGRLEHIDFTHPYTPALREALIEAARGCGLALAEQAVHGITQGPRLETAAEIERMARDGCDIVGMTGMPEAALAREAGLEYACAAMVVNKAAGRTGGLAIHDEIDATIVQGTADLERLLQAALPKL